MMMSLIALLIAQAQVAPELPSDQEIVVTGQRWSRVQYGMSLNRLTGATKCRISRSSGDYFIDKEVCDIARKCAKLPPMTRKSIEDCVEQGKRRFLLSYVPRKD